MTDIKMPNGSTVVIADKEPRDPLRGLHIVASDAIPDGELRFVCPETGKILLKVVNLGD